MPSTEAFPLVVPQNVTIIGWDDSANAPTSRKVTVPAGQTGFTIASSNVHLSYLAIAGTSTVANPAPTARFARGIVASAPSANTAISGISFDHLSVTNALDDGVLLGNSLPGGGGATIALGAAVTVGPGVTITGSGYVLGTTAQRASGLRIIGSAVATVVGGAGVDQTSFVANTQHGVQVAQLGQLIINATAPAAAPYDGAPIVSKGNLTANLAINQTPIGAAGNAPPMPLNTVTGFVSLNGGANGIRVEGGSRLKLRSSVSLGNVANGVIVAPSNWPTTGADPASAADDAFLGGVDLGRDAAANKGGNVLQAPGATVGFSTAQNHGAGVCLTVQAIATAGQTLQAAGNVFAGSGAFIDCAATAANTPVVKNNLCASTASAVPTSVGVTGRLNANSVKLDNCLGQ